MDNSTIASLLKELIIECNRVSLPCLGSFLSGYSPAVISDEFIHPPSKSIVFHQNEIWNDEKLEKLIAQKNNISIGVAKEKLAFWIDDVCVLLATGEKVNLPGLGELYVSSQSKLMFDQLSDNLLSESFGLEPIVIETKTKKGLETQKPKKKKEKKKSKIIIVIALILVLIAAALFAVFRYILNDKQVLPPEIVIIEQVAEINLKYDEYISPEYGILVSSFDKYAGARDFIKENQLKALIYIINKEKPFNVILADYQTQEKANAAIDSIKNYELFSQAQIVKLDSLKLPD